VLVNAPNKCLFNNRHEYILYQPTIWSLLRGDDLHPEDMMPAFEIGLN
jgi:hypothetical protein